MIPRVTILAAVIGVWSSAAAYAASTTITATTPAPETVTLTGDKEAGRLASISIVAMPKGSGSDPTLKFNLASLPSQPDGLYTWTGHIAAGQYRFAINSPGAISSTPAFLTITAATGANANLPPDRNASAN